MPTNGTRIFRRRPRIKPSILDAVSRIVVIARTIFHFIVQVFRHPNLRTNRYRLVSPEITSIEERSFRYLGIIWRISINAANRKFMAFRDISKINTIAIIMQKSNISIFTIKFRSVPKKGIIAFIVEEFREIRSLEHKSRRECRKSIIIATIAVVYPAIRRFKHFPRNGPATRSRDQRIPFRTRWQVPAIGASIHCGFPFVKATVFNAAIRIFFMAEAFGQFIIQVFGHPNLRTDFHRLVNLTVTRIRHQSVNKHIIFIVGSAMSTTACN